MKGVAGLGAVQVNFLENIKMVENTSDPLEIERCGQQLKVLADPTRLAVLRLLMLGPCHVHELAEQLKVEQSLLSHHLKTLREATLVDADRQGKSVVYRLSHEVASTSTSTSTGGGGGGCNSLNLGCCELSFDLSKKTIHTKGNRDV